MTTFQRVLSTACLALTLAGCGAAHAPALAVLPVGAQTSLGAAASSWDAPPLAGISRDPGFGSSTSANWPACENFREVNASLYRGGLPSQDDLARLKAMGVKTDIDLMGVVPVFDPAHVAIEKRWAQAAGLNFVQVAVPTDSRISPAFAQAFLKAALDPANQPCYVHCLHGRDRTGTMVAVYRMVHDHLTNQQALAEMESIGFVPGHYPALAHFVENYTVGE